MTELKVMGRSRDLLLLNTFYKNGTFEKAGYYVDSMLSSVLERNRVEA